jgi:hypothetical protein
MLGTSGYKIQLNLFIEIYCNPKKDCSNLRVFVVYVLYVNKKDKYKIIYFNLYVYIYIFTSMPMHIYFNKYFWFIGMFSVSVLQQ